MKTFEKHNELWIKVIDTEVATQPHTTFIKISSIVTLGYHITKPDDLTKNYADSIGIKTIDNAYYGETYSHKHEKKRFEKDLEFLKSVLKI